MGVVSTHVACLARDLGLPAQVSGAPGRDFCGGQGVHGATSALSHANHTPS